MFRRALQLEAPGVWKFRAWRVQVGQQPRDVARQRVDPQVYGRSERPLRHFRETLPEQPGGRSCVTLFQVVETGGDLNQTLEGDLFDAVELAPGVFPELVRAEIRAAIERRPPLFEPVPHRFAERAHACALSAVYCNRRTNVDFGENSEKSATEPSEFPESCPRFEKRLKASRAPAVEAIQNLRKPS